LVKLKIIAEVYYDPYFKSEMILLVNVVLRKMCE